MVEERRVLPWVQALWTSFTGIGPAFIGKPFIHSYTNHEPSQWGAVGDVCLDGAVWPVSTQGGRICHVQNPALWGKALILSRDITWASSTSECVDGGMNPWPLRWEEQTSQKGTIMGKELRLLCH
jgi:hypothetical protein